MVVESLKLAMISRHGRRFDLAVCLFQQALRPGRVPVHIELVRILRSSNFGIRLIDQPLRCSQVRMPPPAYVLTG